MTPKLIEIHEGLGDRWIKLAKGLKAADQVELVGWLTIPPDESGRTSAMIFWKDENLQPVEVWGPRAMLPELVVRAVVEAVGCASN